jgi:hypothetical protein
VVALTRICADDAKPSVAQVTEVLKNHADDSLGVDAAVALVQMGEAAADSGLTHLVHLLRIHESQELPGEAWELPVEAQRALADIGRPAVPALVEVLQRKQGIELCSTVLMVLSDIGEGAGDAIPIVVKMA